MIRTAFGLADRELGVPVTSQTRFNIASVTKPMTTVLAIRLIEEGRLSLRDSIARWIPGFPSGDSITVAHLLGHRSGIPHEVIPDSEMVRPFTAAEVVERAKKLPSTSRRARVRATAREARRYWQESLRSPAASPTRSSSSNESSARSG